MHLLGVFAHPDDETYMAGGSMAIYTDEGIGATLLTFTRGEAGAILEGTATRETLGDVRETELRKAAAILGCSDVRVVGTPDGGTTNTDDGIGLIVDVLREVRPEVVVTMEPLGVTSHPDHIAVCEMTTAAVDRVRDEGIVKRLYYGALPQPQLDEWIRLAQQAGVNAPFDPSDPLAPRGADPATIACVVELTPDALARKINALWAHKTQSDQFVGAQPESVTAAVLNPEHFQRAYPPFSGDEPLAHDLFEGLR